MSNIQIYAPPKLDKKEVQDILEHSEKRYMDARIHEVFVCMRAFPELFEQQEDKYIYIIPKPVFEECRKQIEFFTSMGAENLSSVKPYSDGRIDMEFYFKDTPFSITKEQILDIINMLGDEIFGIEANGFTDKPGFVLMYSYRGCVSKYDRDTLERVED